MFWYACACLRAIAPVPMMPTFIPGVTPLEIHLQAELQDAGRIGRGDMAEERTVQRRDRAQQVRVVEAVEALAAEFKLHGLRQREEPADRSIQIGVGRTDQRIRLGVPVRAGGIRLE